MFTKINTKMTEARDEEGFTLIELLVVILIIGILAAIAIPVFLNQQKAAVKGGIKSDVRNTATNVATSLVTSPSATGFTPYAAGATAPTVTGGAVAVQTVNTSDDVITITKNPASGAAPSTGTGAGQWDDYQIVGTSARVPNYCFVFSSTSGKYTEYNDCTVATGSTGSGSTTPPATTAPAFTPVDVYNNTGTTAGSELKYFSQASGSGYTTKAFNISTATSNPSSDGNQSVLSGTSYSYRASGTVGTLTLTNLPAGTYKASAAVSSNTVKSPAPTVTWVVSATGTGVTGTPSQNSSVKDSTWGTAGLDTFTTTSAGDVTITFSHNTQNTGTYNNFYLDTLKVTQIG